MKRLSREKVEQQIAQLEVMSTPALQARWRELYELDPPHKIRAGFLRLAIAYRLQEQAFGGLSFPTKRQLIKISEQSRPMNKRISAQRHDTEAQVSSPVQIINGSGSDMAAPIVIVPSPRPITLSPGTKLMREWNGATEMVDVFESGFGWRGKTYKTLSAVAVAITGTKWSGPKFFGLREDQKGRGSGGGARGSGEVKRLSGKPSSRALAELVGGQP